MKKSERTQRAVIDALLALINEGDPQPGAPRVAERAGVSTRTVFAHFATLEDLYRASVERATGRVLSLLTPIDPDQPLAGRVDALCAQRARVNEEIGPVLRAAARRAGASPALAVATERGRRASYEQLDRLFAPELAGLDAPARRRRLAAADALVSAESWDLLRTTHGLEPDEARLAGREALRALLGPAPASSASPEAAPAADDARVEAVERALADVDQRIERLVAALEAGSPPDLLAARLRALGAARAALERDAARARAGRDR